MKLKRINHPKYNYEFTENFTIRLNSLRNCESYLAISDLETGEPVLNLNKDVLTIYSGYRFDGCSASPDFDRAIYGCAVHDALIQILDYHPYAFDIQDAHNAMFEIHSKSQFKLKWIYYLVVSSWLGNLYHILKRI